jgi:outer membrane receptor protein involved in Fe transport
MTLRRIFFLPLLLLLLPLPLFAQVRTNSLITGRVTDPQAKSAVEYANIVVFDTVTKKMVTGVVTDSTGKFRIDKVPFGHYYIEYSFIGYEKQRTKPFTLSRKHPLAELGELSLAPSAINMQEVTIAAERNMMISRIDRKVFNVQKDIQAQTGTVTDILQTIPSVSVDMDGNISLRGSGVTVLINGRPSVLGSSANLEQMPASLVERIEVITNPSAKYKPDGTGGIINIIMKRERKAGYNGSLAANLGIHDRFNTTLQGNLNTGTFNLFGSYGYRQDYRYRTSDLQSQTIDTATHESVYLDQTSEGVARPKSHLVQLGVEWMPSEKNSFGLSGTYNYRDVKRNDTWDNLYSDESLQPTADYTRYMDGKDTEHSIGAAAFYEHTFNRAKEHLLRVDVDFERDSEVEDEDFNNEYTYPLYPDQQEHNHAGSAEQMTDIAVAYSRPLWEDALLETGYEGNIAVTDLDQEVTAYDPDSGQWIPDPDQENRYNSNIQVHALYATVSATWGKFSVMGGLRAEEAINDLQFLSLDTSTLSDYFALYPTLHLSLASGKHEWQLNYSRRVNRPDGEDMNPVPQYRDPRNIFVGNPNLKPEDIHSIEFGYSWRPGDFLIVPTLFYRYKVNGFGMVTTTLNDSTLQTTIDNIATDQSAGLDLSGSWQLAKVLTLNFSASGFYTELDASNLGSTGTRSAFSWNAKLNASVSITKSTLFQFNGQYRSEALTAQGTRSPSWVINLGLRQYLWKKRLSLVLTVSDLFKSQKMTSHINTPELIQASTRRRDGQVFYGGVVIHLGSNGKKQKETKFEFDNVMDRQ